ncbi:MAG: Pls/PosA family non-ribosomal peptide synthetase [Solirubrobacteraceae bacterium]
MSRTCRLLVQGAHVVEKSVEVLTTDLAESSTTQGGYAGPTTGTEKILTEVLADAVRVEQVSVDSHFFDDLGADSMVMALFCARVRKRADLPSVSMKDIYRHPTIRSLTAALADAAPSPVESSVPASTEVATPASTVQYVLCGTLQFLIFLGYVSLAALVIVPSYEWISTGSGAIDLYLRSVLVGGAIFLGMCTLPILAKWMLIGRWKPQQIRIWSLAYVRFWVVKTLVRSNPLVLLMVGTPLYVLYLRALGAKVGRGVAIFSQNVPVCTDLLTIGDGTVIRKDSFISCYRAHAGLIQTGTVTLGKDVFVSEATVIDIETALGDGAQLGHASSLHAGQAVPDGERWHGSPAQRTEVDYRAVEPTACGGMRRAVYSVLQLLKMLALYVPLAIGGVDILLSANPRLTAGLAAGPVDFTSGTFYRDALAASFVLFFGAVLVGLLFVVTVPRMLNLAIKPDRVYRLYGVHYSVHRTITRLTNMKFFTYLFGDSSYIVHYLRCLGYDLSRVEQTGSNFGTVVKHETPFLSSVGRGTMVADGLSIMNADFSNTSFRLSQASIGPHNFLGNHIAYPTRARIGDNCLLATKVMVPIDGKVREGVGLLGSPSFEIPRSVERDSTFDHLKSGDELRRRLIAKNKYNLRSMGLALLLRWIHLFGITLLVLATRDFYQRFGWAAVAGAEILAMVFTTAYFVLIERGIVRFRALRPQFCSIYDTYFWWHERFWKLVIPDHLDKIFSGTPFKNILSRLLGVRLGRRVFDDGCFMPERTLATIGDDCTLNAGSVVQCHSQEDGTFKSDRITIGAGCTLGVGALVHYGVTMGEAAELAPDSFLMKGEEIQPHARWGGNPATELRSYQARSGTEPVPAQPVPNLAKSLCSAASSTVATVSGGRNR